MSLQVHESKLSNIPDHCRANALSDAKDKDYQMTCSHDHLDTCDCCELLASVLADIHDILEKMSDSIVSSDVIEELVFIECQAKQNILAWKANLLWYVNQDEARLEVINALNESLILLVQDWAMKFLPRKFRESQSDWFTRRAMSWHITVATQAGRKQLQMMTFVHVFQPATKTAAQCFMLWRMSLESWSNSCHNWNLSFIGRTVGLL